MHNLCNISYHHASLHKKQSPPILPANFIAPTLKDQNTPNTQSPLTSNASPQQEKSPRSSSLVLSPFPRISFTGSETPTTPHSEPHTALNDTLFLPPVEPNITLDTINPQQH